MSDLNPETLAQMLTRTRARLTTFGDSTCTESVVRRGRGEPCGKPAVALRDDREFDVYYPVCARHTRGFCIPVMDRADMHALLDAATELAHMREARDNARAEVERLTAMVRSIRAYCEAFVEESEDSDPEPWNPAAYVLGILDEEADRG